MESHHYLLAKTRALLFLTAFAGLIWMATAAEKKPMNENTPANSGAAAKTERITFGGGCFWCTEAAFQRLKGVESVKSGYAGGKPEDANYKKVSSGITDHAEVVQLEFDPSQVSYEKLLQVFWAAHDPTTLNRQGADVGPQYRSVIFYENNAQKAAAEKSKAEAQLEFKSPIVTQIAPLTQFHVAEDYHQNYFNENGDKNPYCQVVIRPKLQKLLSKGLIKE